MDLTESRRSDSSLEISYKLLCQHGHDYLVRSSESDDVLIDTKVIHCYWEDLKKYHFLQLNGKSLTVKGLFLLYQTANVLYKYNEILNLSHQKFRQQILFPNLIYILTQYLPDTKKFLQATIRQVYDNTRRSSEKIINLYTNSLYLDQDVIKHNVLLDFLGNALGKFDPLIIDKHSSFYRSVFANIFHYYFMKKQTDTSVYSNFWNIDGLNVTPGSTRLKIYRDVLYNLQVDSYYKNSPLYTQLGYNYRIFKNLIINNELQDVYISLNSAKKTVSISNNEYKLVKIYDDDLVNSHTLDKIRKLPTIFRLLKCVHICNFKGKPYNEMTIKPEIVKSVVLDELSHPFRNMFNEGYLQPILYRISENFVNSVLSGEYINLLTLTSTRIDQISFVEQLRKFVRICLDELKLYN